MFCNEILWRVLFEVHLETEVGVRFAILQLFPNFLKIIFKDFHHSFQLFHTVHDFEVGIYAGILVERTAIFAIFTGPDDKSPFVFVLDFSGKPERDFLKRPVDETWYTESEFPDITLVPPEIHHKLIHFANSRHRRSLGNKVLKFL